MSSFRILLLGKLGGVAGTLLSFQLKGRILGHIYVAPFDVLHLQVFLLSLGLSLLLKLCLSINVSNFRGFFGSEYFVDDHYNDDELLSAQDPDDYEHEGPIKLHKHIGAGKVDREDEQNEDVSNDSIEFK
jgi:hypothetical protein